MFSLAKRVFLFLAVNLLVVAALSLVMNLLGVKPYLSARGIDYSALLAFCAVYGFGGAFISLQLSRWSAKRMMGVQLIDPERPRGHAEAFLLEKTRALSSRAGLSKLPEIGIYPSPEVNAFATGPSKSRSLLAVSSGLLDRMDDRAVEGVIGHELSHIANGDMVTMTLLQGVVNTFVMFLARVLAFAIDNALSSRDDRRGGGLGRFGYMMVVMVLESTLMLLAMPLVFWFSRRREYRADAGSASVAGRDTMIHALESLAKNAGLSDAGAPALAMMKISGRARGSLAALFSSHPPLALRIEALKRA